MSEYVYAGLTSQTIDIFLQDSSSSTGQGLAGLVYNSASLVASYRKGATGSRTAITLATQTVGGAWSSGGFVEIDATDMKGVYRLDIPNAAVDTEGFVTLYLYGATNLLPTALRIDCRPLPVDVKKFGGTALTAAAGIPEVKIASIAANAVNASALATDAVTEIQNGLATQVSVDDLPTNAELATALGTADDAVLAAIATVQSDTNDIQTRLPAALESGRIAAVLDSATATQIDAIESALTTLGSDSTTVERSVSDTNAITFSWPVSGASITGTASLNNGSYGAVAGAIAFLRTETGRHYYTLAYNVADRPAAEGQVRYKFVDGTYTGYVVLRTVNLVTTAQVNAEVLDVLSVDTFAELTAPPAATSSLKDKITWLFMYARNKVTQTATQRKVYRDDTTTVAGTSATSDNGTTFTKGEDS
jgi:hypothetical protein